MANLTITIEDSVLSEAQKGAHDRDTTVSQMVREYLSSTVSEASERKAAIERLLSRRYPLKEIDWKRSDLYER